MTSERPVSVKVGHFLVNEKYNCLQVVEILEKWNKNWSKMVVWITNEVQNQNHQLLKNDPFSLQQIAEK